LLFAGVWQRACLKYAIANAIIQQTQIRGGLAYLKYFRNEFCDEQILPGLFRKNNPRY